MKVIKKGREQKGWAIEKTCTGRGHGSGGCEAVLLVEEEDIYATTHGSNGDSEYCRTFKCPECGQENDFIVAEIPITIWSKTDRQP